MRGRSHSNNFTVSNTRFCNVRRLVACVVHRTYQISDALYGSSGDILAAHLTECNMKEFHRIARSG